MPYLAWIPVKLPLPEIQNQADIPLIEQSTDAGYLFGLITVDR